MPRVSRNSFNLQAGHECEGDCASQTQTLKGRCEAMWNCCCMDARCGSKGVCNMMMANSNNGPMVTELCACWLIPHH